MKHIIELDNEEKSFQLGELLAAAIQLSKVSLAVIYLKGDLGAGKTTMSRGVLSFFDHQGNVKSPTYTLVEPYELQQACIYHFDLYRLGDPEELEFMGIRDYFEAPSKEERPVICLVEWPEKGRGYISKPDIEVCLSVVGQGRRASVEVNHPVLSELIKTKLAGGLV